MRNAVRDVFIFSIIKLHNNLSTSQSNDITIQKSQIPKHFNCYYSTYALFYSVLTMSVETRSVFFLTVILVLHTEHLTVLSSVSP